MSKSISKTPWRRPLLFWLFLSFLISFSLKKTQAQTPNAWINELHYDNVGNDVGEGVEVVIENAALFDISSFTITLYNGSDGKAYKSMSLDEERKGETVHPFTIYAVFITGIQNDLEGVALSYEGKLLQFLSYGGTFTATDGVAQGTTAVDIVVKESNQTPEHFSLQLEGVGNRYNAFEWHEPLPNTFGQVNPGQILRLIDGPQPITDLKEVHVAPDKVQISWTKPIGVHKEDWDGVLLFASQDGPNELEFINRDFTDFQGGNHVFGEGTRVGNSYTVARKETNEHGEVIITGLERGVNYYFTAYTYKNINGNNNDLFSGPSNMAVVKPEVADISALSATPLFEKARLNWSNSMGNKDWWKTTLILASKNPIKGFPDKRNYAANVIYGEGEVIGEDVYAVYNGQEAQTAIYGLENNIPYYFKVFVQYEDAQKNFYWSEGKSISCTPTENIKLWTGNAGSNKFLDDDNWEPKGAPSYNHDVVLDHRNINAEYEVIFPSGDAPIQLNSLKILPGLKKTITVKLSATPTNEAALTLLDEDQPLIIDDYGIFINSASGQGTLAIPNGSITLKPKGTYKHNNTSSHKAIIENIQTEEGCIPGTIFFAIPSNQNHIISLSGKTFQKLVFSSSTHNPSYSASGNNAIVIEEALVIDNASLNLSTFNGLLEIKGDLILDGKLTSRNAIIFNGTEKQVISGNVDALATLDKIKVNKPTSDLTLNKDIQIQSSLILEQGNLITHENHVILNYKTDSPEVLISKPNAKLLGNLEVTRHVGKGKVDFEEAGVVIEAGEDDLGLVKIIRRTGPDAVIAQGENKSIYRNWEISSDGSLTKNRKLTFSWEEGEDEEVDLMSVKVWKKNKTSGEWVSLGDFQDGSQRTIATSIDEFTQFTVVDEHNVLPLTLLSITAELHFENALLQWKTLSESNNAGFQIEKSLDSSHFYTIGFVAGKGNNLNNYHFIDSLFNESAYFRLKQLDIDGKATFSPILYLAFPSHQDISFIIFPNPILDKINLSLSPKTSIEFCTLYFEGGETVYKSKALSTERLENELNAIIPDLPSGLYILHLGIKRKVRKIKLLKESR